MFKSIFVLCLVCFSGSVMASLTCNANVPVSCEIVATDFKVYSNNIIFVTSVDCKDGREYYKLKTTTQFLDRGGLYGSNAGFNRLPTLTNFSHRSDNNRVLNVTCHEQPISKVSQRCISKVPGDFGSLVSMQVRSKKDELELFRTIYNLKLVRSRWS